MSPQPSVLDKLQWAQRLITEALSQAPTLYDCRLDQALLVLSWSIQRARRSPRMRWRLPPGYVDQDLPL
jgi:putative SOS response-associated peptidase YedK